MGDHDLAAAWLTEAARWRAFRRQRRRVACGAGMDPTAVAQTAADLDQLIQRSYDAMVAIEDEWLAGRTLPC